MSNKIFTKTKLKYISRFTITYHGLVVEIRTRSTQVIRFDNVAPELTWVAVIAVLHSWETVIKMS